jgi:hypothetical protein
MQLLAVQISSSGASFAGQKERRRRMREKKKNQRERERALVEKIK